jgi:FeS assembly SUF system protein
MREEEPTPQSSHRAPDQAEDVPAGEKSQAESEGQPQSEAPASETGDSSQPASEANAEQGGTLRVFEEDVVEALKHVYDPEIPINVYELGLIYGVSVDDQNNVHVEMTLTTPNCPEAENIPPKARGMIKKMVPGVNQVEINLVWEPAWTMEMMSEDAKLALGLF